MAHHSSDIRCKDGKSLKEYIYIDQVKDNLNKIHFDAAVHLFLNKRVGLSTIRALVEKIDMLINRKLVGRDYSHDKRQGDRVRFYAFYEKTPSNGNSHIHLMIKFGNREHIYRLEKVIRQIWSKLWDGGTIGRVQLNANHIVDSNRRDRAHKRNNNKIFGSFTDQDIWSQIDYYTKELRSETFFPSRGWA